MCYTVNESLMKYNYFFRIFEIKDKSRYLMSENSTKKHHKKTFKLHN